MLDIAGTERLFGPPQKLAQRLRAALAAAGFRASIAVSANFHAARMKAVNHRGIAVIPEGEEANTLASLPIAALGLAEEPAETFALWGIRTLGELAAMPEDELVARLGVHAREWSALARGAAAHVFQPIELALSLEEFCEFETPVEQMDSLLFIGARMIDCLVARAASRALALAALTVRMKLEGGGGHERTIRPALPSMDRKFLLKLLQLEIAAHPPQAAVAALTLAAEAGQSSQVQLGLFAPQTPEPSRLDVTLARLKAMVGDDRVGSPVLEDTHRADSFRMASFIVDGKASALETQHSADGSAPHAPTGAGQCRAARHDTGCLSRSRGQLCDRCRIRPMANQRLLVVGRRWDAEEWDVLAVENNGALVACLLTCDRARNAWRLEAFYD